MAVKSVACKPTTKPALSDGPAPLEARATLIHLLRTRAPRAELERAADVYREAIRALAKRTGRKLPVPSRAFILRLLA